MVVKRKPDAFDSDLPGKGWRSLFSTAITGSKIISFP